MRPAELDTPPCPPALSYLLGVFFELAQGRQTGFGPQPLTLAEIEAYSRLSATALQWWEVQALRALDALWLKAWADGRPNPQKARRPTGA